MFDNESYFKQDFNTLLKGFVIKLVSITINSPQDNAPVERLHQVILDTLVNKDIDHKIFEYIYPWGETLTYIVCLILASYNRTKYR